MLDAQSLSNKLNEPMKGLNRQIDSLGGISKPTLSVLFEPALSKAALENENVGKKDGNLMVLPPWARLVHLAMA
ncbi:hypothetical protein [Candidatus Vondammii sp. HM_W22]|uniref:hypothetical protein n=1 Tax=Candidatus Vondammii sp. HM_W22 TaxID=2687299 RepID=UPI001F1423D6|nr:hypothetical protein [Candidatus Vondammii sp. HM_W22]